MEKPAAMRFVQGVGGTKVSYPLHWNRFRFDRGLMLGKISTMRKLFRKLHQLKSNSFTLVELLVVITIIGMIAGLATPAIQGGLDSAKQKADVANGRQLYMVLTMEADDNNGMYRRSLELTNTNMSTALDVFKGLYNDRAITAFKIFAGNNVRTYTGTDANGLVGDNIAWAYGNGLDRSDDGSLPILITKKNGAVFGTPDITCDKVNSPWRDKGVAIIRLGGDGFFLKAKNLQVKGALSTNTPAFTGAAIQDP